MENNDTSNINLKNKTSGLKKNAKNLLRMLLVAFVITVGYNGYKLIFPAQWQLFTSSNDHLEILFPTPPTHDVQHEPISQDGTMLDHSIYLSLNANPSDKTGYIVDAVVLFGEKIDVSDPTSVLKASLDEMVATGNSNLISSGAIKYKGYDALSFLIQNGDKNVKGIKLLAGNSYYEIGVIYYGNTFNESDYNKFINSFEIR